VHINILFVWYEFGLYVCFRSQRHLIMAGATHARAIPCTRYATANWICSFYQPTNGLPIEQTQDQVGSPKHGCLGIEFLPSKKLHSEKRACDFHA
jgi:hypothetical protein